MKDRFTRFLILGLIVLVSACSGAMTKLGEKDIPDLQRRLVQTPNNPQVLRDLGIAHYNVQKYNLAEDYLSDAYGLAPMDPQTALYYGLTHEALGRPAMAVEIYRTYSQFSQSNNYTRLMEGRYLQVRRKILQDEIADLAQKEQSGQLTEGRLVAEAVAVFPFDYLGTVERFEPLGRGLSAFMISDLGQVSGLRILERERLQVLLDEIALGETDYVSTETAPRTGRILGAGRVVGGTFDVLGEERLNIDTGYWDLANQQTDFLPEAGLLEEVFQIQKSLVFDLLDRMGITLTEAERNAIQRIPTRDLQAFLYYCRGLEEEDRGNYQAAVQLYQQAVQEDPGFAEAEVQQETLESRIAAGPSFTNIDFSYNFVAGSTGLIGQVTQNFLVDERLRILGIGTGYPFVVGEEQKKGFEDFNVIGTQTLPDPPLPPGRE